MENKSTSLSLSLKNKASEQLCTWSPHGEMGNEYLMF